MNCGFKLKFITMKRLLLLLLVFFIGCSAPTITSNCDETVDFTAYKTFSFSTYSAKTKPLRPEYNNPENRAIIRQAITKELISLGYSEANGNTDLAVEFDIVITEMVDPRVDSAVVYKPWVDTKIDSFNYTEGLLIIRLIDRAKGNLVWQGSLSGILNRKPEKFGKNAEAYISKLFASLAERRQ
jgi:uncharacterized protein DUF4136